MTDIVERLRASYMIYLGKPHFCSGAQNNRGRVIKAADLHEAADEIERLRETLRTSGARDIPVIDPDTGRLQQF